MSVINLSFALWVQYNDRPVTQSRRKPRSGIFVEHLSLAICDRGVRLLTVPEAMHLHIINAQDRLRDRIRYS